MPTGPPLSFPPVVSGNPVFFLFLCLCGPAGEKDGFPINNVGNDRGGIERVGHDRGAIEHVGHDGRPALAPLLFPPILFCHSRRLLAGIQCFAFLFLYLCGPAWENHGFPINNVGNDRGGLEHVGNDRGAIDNVGNDRGAITNIGHDGRGITNVGYDSGGLPASGMGEGKEWQDRGEEAGRV